MRGRFDEQFPADHLAYDPSRIRLGNRLGSNVAPIPKHRDVVAEGEEFLEAVRDIHHGNAPAFKFRDEVKQLPGLTGGKRTGGLIHDNDPSLSTQRGGYLYQLF